MKEGILYTVTDGVVRAGRRLSPVEMLKDMVGFVVHQLTTDLDAVILAKRRAIEVYLLVKWGLLLFLWAEGDGAWWSLAIIVYLMTFNLHSYFDHHLWNPVGQMSRIRLRRRFLSLLQGAAFNAVGFAYIYSVHLASDFQSAHFSMSEPSVAVSFSVFNTFAGGSDIASPITGRALLVSAAQLFTTFVFLGILVSQSTLEERNNQDGI